MPSSAYITVCGASFVLGILGAITKPAFAADCTTNRVAFCEGCTVTENVRVLADKKCIFTSTTGSGGIDGKEIITRPRAGTFETSNQIRSVYTPRSGYIGDDLVEVRVYYIRVDGKRTYTNIRYAIKVVKGPL